MKICFLIFETFLILHKPTLLQNLWSCRKIIFGKTKWNPSFPWYRKRSQRSFILLFWQTQMNIGNIYKIRVLFFAEISTRSRANALFSKIHLAIRNITNIRITERLTNYVGQFKNYFKVELYPSIFVAEYLNVPPFFLFMLRKSVSLKIYSWTSRKMFSFSL